LTLIEGSGMMRKIQEGETNMPKKFFEEMEEGVKDAQMFFAKKEALKEAKKAEFQKKLQALRNN